jgi:hypothetical protein
LEILREQQVRLELLREERRILLEELERLREQKERLQWLREGRAALLAELERLCARVEEKKSRTDVQFSPPAEVRPLGDTAAGNQRHGHAVGNRGKVLSFREFSFHALGCTGRTEPVVEEPGRRKRTG